VLTTSNQCELAGSEQVQLLSSTAIFRGSQGAHPAAGGTQPLLLLVKTLLPSSGPTWPQGGWMRHRPRTAPAGAPGSGITCAHATDSGLGLLLCIPLQ
jgi:hypothetical protein